MPYCPRCRLEYEQGTTRCPECGEELVEGTLKSDEPKETQLEVAYVGASEVDVLRAQAFLEAEGIVGVIRKFGPASYLFDDAIKDPSGAWGEILVAAHDVERAKRLLESLEPIPPDELSETSDK